MKHTGLTTVCAAFTTIAVGGSWVCRAGAVEPEGSEVVLRVTPEFQVIEAISGEAASLLRRAADLAAGGQAGHSELRRRAAGVLARIPGAGEHARTALHLVLANPESTFDVFEAHRMLGGIWLGDGNDLEALTSFDAAVETWRAAPNSVMATVVVSCLQEGAISASQCCEHARAAEFWLTLRDLEGVKPEWRHHAALAGGRALSWSGNLAAARCAYEDAFAMFPELLAGDSGVSRRLRAVLDTTLEAEPEDRIARLTSLWEDPAIRGFPESLRVGDKLVEAHRKALPPSEDFSIVYSDAILDVLLEAADLIGEREAEWMLGLPGPAERSDLAGRIRRMLTEAVDAGRSRGRPADVYEVALDCVQRYAATHREEYTLRLAGVERMLDAQD